MQFLYSKSSKKDNIKNWNHAVPFEDRRPLGLIESGKREAASRAMV